MKPLAGLFAALLTPFDEEGKINEQALRQLTAKNIEKGISGFYVCGSTAEAFLLSFEERKRILETVLDETAGKVKVICHIGAISTDFSIKLGHHAQETGADAVSSIPPFYYKFSVDELIGYYTDIADSIQLPLIPYNFPGLSGVSLTSEMMSRLREHKNIIGVKFTSNDLYQLEGMKNDDPDLLIYNGLDEIFLAGLSMGADGAIGSTFNFMPEKYINIQKAYKQGDMRKAAELQTDANEVIRVLLKTGKLLNAQKYVLEKQHIQSGMCRRPFLPLTEDDKRLVDEVFEQRLQE